MVSPLDQLYLDTTSKEDLLAEINDQRQQVIEACGIASELQRKLWAVEAERCVLLEKAERLKKLESEIKIARTMLSTMRKKAGNSKPRSNKASIIDMHEDGLKPAAIRDKTGWSYDYIRKVVKEYKKAAQST